MKTLLLNFAACVLGIFALICALFALLTIVSAVATAREIWRDYDALGELMEEDRT